jgi:hypothetical protein
MQIIILDGRHKGEVIDWSKPMQKIKLLKPPVFTVCDCNRSAGDEEFGPSEPEEIIYKCAFRSVDGRVALLSRTGNSMDFYDNFSHVYRLNIYSRTEPLYFNCHDAKAWG